MMEKHSDLSPSGFLSFFAHLGQAKRTYRSGWILRGIDPGYCESIADHICIEMCLLHDLPECIVGDLTPSENINKEDKHLLENSSFLKLIEMIGADSVRGKEMKELYKEYNDHSSAEAKYVKSLDLFDMFITAYEYEMIHKCDLTEFFSNVPKCLENSSFFTPQVKSWIEELMKLRENKVDIRPNDSNMNTILKDILRKK